MSTTQARTRAADSGTELARDRLGAETVMCFIATAATPLTVIAGVVTTGFATTGLLGIPIAFLGVGCLLLLFSVGYVAMGRHVRNAGAFYAYIAHLGRPLGVGAAWVALVAYNALQVGLYGLLGSTASPLLDQWLGLEVPWWLVAAGCWLFVALLGRQAVDINGRVLAALLVAEIVIIVVLSASNLLHPAGGEVDLAALAPGALVGDGAGAILVLAMLGFIGFEAATVYAEESRDPRRTVPLATYTSVIVLALLYTVASWAMTVAVGTDTIVAASQEQQTGVIFGLAGAQLGSTVVTITEVLLITSIVAATVSFHNTVARYMFSLGREGVLPRALGRTGPSGAPRAASAAQSVIGALVIAGYAVGGLDPLVELFFYAGTAGGLGVLLLVTLTSVCVVRFFAADRRGEGAWSASIAPVLATLLLCLVSYAGVSNMPELLGTPPGSPLPWLVPTVYACVTAAGVAWGLFLSVQRPAVYAGIGAGPR